MDSVYAYAWIRYSLIFVCPALSAHVCFRFHYVDGGMTKRKRIKQAIATTISPLRHGLGFTCSPVQCIF